MLVKFVCTIAAAIRLALASPASMPVTPRAPAPFSDFTNNEFFKPGPGAVLWGTLYARSLQLANGELLMTWENYPAEPPLVNHPIYKSKDGGATWSNFSAIYDQVNGWGMRFQPFLYTLPVAFGGFPAGTILAAGVSCPKSLTGGVWIDLYASTDQAATFNFVSHIAYGNGPEIATNDGNAALWEPFILYYNGKIIVYYSDQRDVGVHGQKLSQQTTTDLKTWSSAVDAEVESDATARPGMMTVAHIESTGKWIMTFEMCEIDNCNVHFKIASDPLSFGSVQSQKLTTVSGTTPVSAPYIIWTQNLAKNDGSGLLILSSTSNEQIFINDDSATNGNWKIVDVGMWSAYSRSLNIVSLAGKKKLLFGNGGNFGPLQNNGVACGVIEVPTL